MPNYNKLIFDKQQKILKKQREIIELKDDIRDLKNKMYSTCNHKWIKENDDDGPYSKSYQICSICSMYRNKYLN